MKYEKSGIVPNSGLVVAAAFFAFVGLGCQRRQGSLRVRSVYRTLTWESLSGDTYTIDLAISFADLQAAQALLGANEDTKLSASIKWVQRAGLAAALGSLARRHGETPHEVVMTFVQSIPYKTSADPGLLPAHLLAAGAGDCDDKVYLAVALLRVLGYDAAFWDVVDGQHAGVGIVLPNVDGVSVEWGGREYLFWEATASGWRPGRGELASHHRVRLVFPTK